MKIQNITKMGVITIFALLTVLLSVNNVQAGNLTVNTQATSQIAASCSVNSGNITIGTIIPGTPSSSGQTQVNVLCTKGTVYSWYPSFRQAGWDCPFLTGAISSDHIYYMFYYDGHYQVYTSQMNVNPHTAVGNGAWQSAPLLAYIQPNQSYGPCPTKPVNPGYNPYVTPDNYSDNDSIILNF